METQKYRRIIPFPKSAQGQIGFERPRIIPQEDLVRLLVEGELNYRGLDFEFWRGPGKGIIRAYEIKSDGNNHIADYDPITGKIIEN